MIIRMYRSCLNKKKIEEYKKASDSVSPAKYNKRISNQSTSEIIKVGAELMKKENFKLVSSEVVKGL